jgi:kumamolisin
MSEPPVGYVHVEGTNRSPVPGATKVGPADPAERLSVSIRLRRRADAPALPDPSQAQGPLGTGMSREEFGLIYGADPADIERVEAFASQHGLAVEETSIPRRTVVLSGAVAQMSEAFQVDLGRYQGPQISYRGREGYVNVPSELGPLVKGVFGLDNRPQARPMVRQADPAQATSELTPPQVARLYNFPAGVNADGQCIGLIELGGGYQPADINNWFSGLKLTPPVLTDVSVDSGTNSPGSDQNNDDLEVALDIDVAGSVAQGARIAVYFAPNTNQGFSDAVSSAVHDTANKPSVISISWGGAESGWSSAAMSAMNETFAEAANLGITVLVATGDQGSECSVKDGQAHVEYPASDPGVIACGGTTIENVSGTSFSEVLWTDTAGASGGGVSNTYPVPVWQDSAGVPASVNPPHNRGRGVPDVAGNASDGSGYSLIVDGQTVDDAYGTSAVAPLYAGLIALINAQSSFPVGYLNPTLYQKAESVVFRDITSGGTNAFGGAPGYPVGPGWDATTGLGSINGEKLSALLGPATKVIPSYLTTAVVPGPQPNTQLLQLFYRGQDNSIYSRWRNENGTWSTEQHIGGLISSDITAAQVPGGDVVQLFYRGQDNAVWTRWRNSGGNWSSEQDLDGALTSDIAAAVLPGSGVLQLFYRGQDNSVWTRWRNTNGTWSSEQSLGGILN